MHSKTTEGSKTTFVNRKPFETVRIKTTTRYIYDEAGRLSETTTMTYEDHFDPEE